VARVSCLLALVVALIVAGCDASSSAKRKMEGQKAPSWPALDALAGDGGMQPIGMSLQMENSPKAAKKAAADPKFKELLDNFEKEAIPFTFSTAAREAAKKDLVESLRKIADASDSDVKAIWEKATASLGTLKSP
jgi:hypothetical protein